MNYDDYGFEIFDDEWVFTPENSKEPVQKTDKPKENTIPNKPKTGMLF